MKIRKILPLLLLAVGSVLMLSSCDALLDAIFQNNTINVYVTAYVPTYGYNPGTDQVYVQVVGPTSATAYAGYTGYDAFYNYWSVSIPKLSDGTYTVLVDFYNWNGAHPPQQWRSVSVPDPAGNHQVNVQFNF